jgi:hypothetical protein
MTETVEQTMCQNGENEKNYRLSRHFGTNNLGI